MFFKIIILSAQNNNQENLEISELISFISIILIVLGYVFNIAYKYFKNNNIDNKFQAFKHAEQCNENIDNQNKSCMDVDTHISTLETMENFRKISKTRKLTTTELDELKRVFLIREAPFVKKLNKLLSENENSKKLIKYNVLRDFFDSNTGYTLSIAEVYDILYPEKHLLQMCKDANISFY